MSDKETKELYIWICIPFIAAYMIYSLAAIFGNL